MKYCLFIECTATDPFVDVFVQVIVGLRFFQNFISVLVSSSSIRLNECCLSRGMYTIESHCYLAWRWATIQSVQKVCPQLLSN